MNTIQIQNFSEEEFKSFIKDTIEQSVKDLLPEPTSSITYLTRQETANKLGVSLVTLHKWTKSGIVKGHHINSRVRYKSDEIDRALQEIESTKYRRR